MISEAAITGKPVYVAMMKPKDLARRFKSFYNQFKNLGITKELTDSIDNWSYDKLDEVNRIAPINKRKNEKKWNYLNHSKAEQNHLMILLNILKSINL